MSNTNQSGDRIGLAIIMTALTIVYYVWLITEWNFDGKPKASPTEIQRAASSSPSRHIGSQPHGAPLPQYAYYIHQPRYICDSFLTVKTSRDAAYVIKVVNPYNGETILTCYLPGGISQELALPSGNFEIRYTCGTEWFGNQEMFGPTASYAKAQRTFQFTKDAGYELTLYKVPHGNLQTTRMRKEDF